MTPAQAEEQSLTGIILELEDDIAIIKTKDGFEIPWPIKDLPLGVTQGSEVKLDLNISDDQGQVAKRILNEILKKQD